MHYILDAYNLLFRWTEGEWGLEEMRENFQRGLLEKFRGRKDRVTLVFDGREAEERRSTWGPFSVVYTSSKESADASIVHLVDQQATLKRLIVVTSDNELANRLRARGCTVQAAEEFLEGMGRKWEGPPSSGRGEAAEELVADEESRRWLKLFEERWKKLQGE